jgi:hypothetical protein
MELLLLTADPEPGSALPALSLLGHVMRPAAPEVTALLDAGSYDAVLVDARWIWPVRAACAGCWDPLAWMCRWSS